MSDKEFDRFVKGVWSDRYVDLLRPPIIHDTKAYKIGFDPKDFSIDDLYYTLQTRHPSYRGGKYNNRFALNDKTMSYAYYEIKEKVYNIFYNYSIYKDDIDIEINPITLYKIFEQYPDELEMNKGLPTLSGFNVNVTYSLPYDNVYIHCKRLSKHLALKLYIPGIYGIEEDDIDIDRELNIEPIMEFLRDEGDEIEMKLPKKYIVNSDAAILIDNNDKKTIVKRHKEDTPDPVKGFLWAYFIKNSGLTRTKANQYLEKIKEDYIDEASKKKKQNKNKKKKTR